ncbi:DNA methyltransferase [Lithospermum erythrorhizon]|uniref:DNA (cytosine-5)-methyltransferase n=1 Tax=Lithospermum erythrorhizon TaxID=34254 RepID=A0AAV3PRK8_LITER
MGRRKKQDHWKSGVHRIDQAELNTKRNTKAKNKRRRIVYNESDPGSYTDRNTSLSYKCRVGKSRKLIVVEEEDEAVRLTSVDEDIQRENRKLDQFYFYDEAFKPQSVEMLQVQPLFISGVILPSEETSVKVKETKVRCDSFGPIESWAISGFDEGKPIVWVSTVTADYECLRAATAYKPFFDLFYEKARACTLIYRKLSKTLGGNPDILLNELIAEVSSSMRRSGNYSHGVPIEPLIMSWGEFIYEQLIGLDETYCDGDTVFNDLPVLLSLRDAGKWRVEHISEKLVTSQGVPCNKQYDQPRDPYDENKNDGSLIIARLMGELETWKLFKSNKGQRSVTAYDISFMNSDELQIEKEFLVPTYFNTGLEKTDESTIFGAQSSEDTDELPQRILHDWSLYTSGSRFISLELLPMRNYGERNVKVYGLGIMTDYIEDGLPIEIDFLQKHGTLIRLSEIQEWLIEFELSGVSILIETDNARYKLGKPSIQYASWYEPVLKTAKLAGRIIKLLREQSRVSRLSFQEAAKKISEFGYDDPDHISSYQEVVQNYLIDHGKMILQVFSNFPDEAIRRCSFVRTLYDLVNEKHHTDDIMEREEILNDVVNMKPEVIEEPTLSKWSEISVTTTKLVNSIWSRGVPNFFPTLSKEDYVEEKNINMELTENAGDNFKEIEEKKILCNKSMGPKWVGSVGGLTSAGEALYNQAVVHSYAVVVGSAVIVEKDDAKHETEIYIVEYMFGTSDARKMVHGRLVVRGFETILGSFANKKEVFLTNICKDFELINVVGTVVIEFQKLTCDKQACHSKRGPPCDYFSKGLYCPEKGSIYSLQSDSVGIGNGHCFSCEYRVSLNLKVFKVSTSMRHFTYEGVDYHVYDFLYLKPGQLAEDKGCRKSLRNDRTERFPPYLVCQFLELKLTMPMEEASPEYLLIKVRRYFRPEDISTEKAYISDIREVYYSRQEFMMPITAVRGKCEVRRKKCFEFSDNPYVFEHIFFCEHQYDTENGALKQLPPRVKLSVPKQSSSEKAGRRKTKSNCNNMGKESHNQHSEKLATPQKFLSALDLFAGCGGLSEGLHQSGVSVTKWAIEADEAAGRAFQLNHPEASVIINNCNVILRAVMLAFGKASDCISTSDIIKLEQELDKEVMDRLPQPDQVDFIYGGPPCQGFSKLNRFTDRPWSVSQSVLIFNFLSFVDVYRPKFVLIENVRNFITFNKGEMFSFALASLIEMGYQVKFGVLEAGAFGISQSRKRAFIWAAAPGETLPEWPEPMHVFAGHDLNVTVDNNTKYAAVRSTSSGAPFRAITVKDSIGDLPEVKNGSSEDTMRYKKQPSSWFQKRIRGDQGVLTDHIAKEMSELNLTRCQKVPKHNGSDWRTLPLKKIKLSNGRSVDLVPQGVRNTAHRHNQWKGVFGRLNWDGYFPTTTTDPHPMHKVGRCFHPEQDRILTIREYARSQGFPDRYNFFGTIQDKHRQIGNAVPPPLAFALGRKLKEVVEGKQQNQ